MLRLIKIKLPFGHPNDTQQAQVLAVRWMLLAAVDDIKIAEVAVFNLNS